MQALEDGWDIRFYSMWKNINGGEIRHCWEMNSGGDTPEFMFESKWEGYTTHKKSVNACTRKLKKVRGPD
ncbi:MAG: hypothetical protein JSW41_04635 [Candidatus Aenigmatarchaeota archaeon]|nr:MAG: hypothetical protein JSW41_04635 [Candidatus Aenigmarchaeota archaeon]